MSTGMTLASDLRRRAVDLAKSGHHIDCLTIETQLDREGFVEAHLMLQDPAVRAALKALCDEHWHPRPDRRRGRIPLGQTAQLSDVADQKQKH
jgi:hypothetical protein